MGTFWPAAPLHSSTSGQVLVQRLTQSKVQKLVLEMAAQQNNKSVRKAFCYTLTPIVLCLAVEVNSCATGSMHHVTFYL